MNKGAAKTKSGNDTGNFQLVAARQPYQCSRMATCKCDHPDLRSDLTIAPFIIGTTLAVFSLVLMGRTMLTPLLLMIQTLLPIGFICSAIFLLPGASTCFTAFFNITIFLIFYTGMGWICVTTMQAGKCGYHFRNLPGNERLTFYRYY